MSVAWSYWSIHSPSYTTITAATATAAAAVSTTTATMMKGPPLEELASDGEGNGVCDGLVEVIGCSTAKASTKTLKTIQYSCK